MAAVLRSSLDRIDALEVTDDNAVGCGDSDGKLGVAVATVSMASTMYVKVCWRHSSSSNGVVLNRGSTTVVASNSRSSNTSLSELDRVLLYTGGLTARE